MGIRDTRQNTTLGKGFRFVIRLMGLTGLVAVVVGLVLAAALFPDPTDLSNWTLGALKSGWQGEYRGSKDRLAEVAAHILLGGAAAAALALVIEAAGAMFLVTGRRSLTGSLSTVGITATVALLVIVNIYSFSHYRRYDNTRDRKFTLPVAVADDLKKLRPDSPTSIVVLQKHRLSGAMSEMRDSYVSAAERTVTEKVYDLVDQFRELGPRFNVAVLDVEAFTYKDRLEALTKDAPELKAAIDAAPENSIFFYASGRVQRLGFNEFLQLDKTASREAENNRGNLVLLPQGVERFARRVLAVQEKRPKVGVAVVHEWLTTQVSAGQEEYTLAGLKKALNDYGFDVVDIVLKKGWGGEKLEPGAYTREENMLERLEGEVAEAESRVSALREEVSTLEEVEKEVGTLHTRPWRERSAFYTRLRVRVSEFDEPTIRTRLLSTLVAQRKRAELMIEEAEKERRGAEERINEAYKDERSLQDRKSSDLKVKMTRLLADVDLLIVPRLTIVNATNAEAIRPTFHNLSTEQVGVIKEFMKSGRPVLACFGPINYERGLREADDLEKLLADRGVELGRDTILYDVETRAFAAFKAGSQLAGGSDIPSLIVADSLVEGGAPPNPVGMAMRNSGRSIDQKFDLRVRSPRPVYLAPAWARKLPFAAEFLQTPAESWNEDNPLPNKRPPYSPRYDPTPLDDPKKGTRDEERRGPFPVAVAIESKIPASWFDDKFYPAEATSSLVTALDPSGAGGIYAACTTAASVKQDRPVGRLVVFGSGGLFNGPDMKPATEKLLVHTVNWLVNRQDHLPQLPGEPGRSWSFPRVALSDREAFLWRLGTAVGMPLTALYLGLVALMIRKVR